MGDIVADREKGGLNFLFSRRLASVRRTAVKRKVPDVNPTQLNRALHAINRADKRDDWFDFLRHVE